jgi:APA family basic amino acid/polyamine antiporter
MVGRGGAAVTSSIIDTDPPSVAKPRRLLGVWQPAAVVVGMVVGAGIFRTASLAAQTLPSEGAVLIAWSLGGVFAVAASLCYAELSTAFPSPGGEYHFLREAFGATVGFLFAWSRFAIIFTASSAMLAFVGADYIAQIVPMGSVARAGVAIGLILALTLLNARGVRSSTGGQMALVTMDVTALLALAVAGITLVVLGGAATHPLGPTAPVAQPIVGFGSAMVFVMLAYGGFNDSATLSAEVRKPSDMTRALIGGMSLVTALYLLANWAYLQGLGLAGLRASDAPAADLMARAFGPVGRTAMAAVVAATSLSSLNALVIVGSRTLYAASADQPSLGRLAQWDLNRGVPRAALWVQATISILLVGWGAMSRRGFAAMVDYMAPVYWLFLAMAGVALVVLRVRRPDASRPYRTPLLPLSVSILIGGAVYILVSSVIYVGWTGCALSFGVLGSGLIALFAARRMGAQPRGS